MKDHGQYAEALALYALGALDNAQERAELEAHLRSCPECRNELAALRGDAALLALSAVGPAPPQRARQRLMEAIGSEPPRRRGGVTQGMVLGVLGPRRLTFVPIAAALLLAVFSLMLWRANSRLTAKVENLQAQVAQTKNQLKDAQELVSLLKAPDSVHMTLVAVNRPPQAQARMVYQPKMGRVLLMANNLQPLPQDKAYELWLLPAHGGAPMPCGMFRPNAKGEVMMDHSMDTAGIEAKAFAITVEPESGSPAPTSPIMMVSAG
jgi:anti-sigma-K factor RskA